MPRWYVYILKCGDGTLYTGIATDVARRLREHEAGTGAKYTRGRVPLCIVHRERFATRSAALKRELAIKRMPRQDKLKLLH
jgi:predicted GIY-YIG superfamily endonuclease